jgi:hypothetical protein
MTFTKSKISFLAGMMVVMAAGQSAQAGGFGSFGKTFRKPKVSAPTFNPPKFRTPKVSIPQISIHQHLTFQHTKLRHSLVPEFLTMISSEKEPQLAEWLGKLAQDSPAGSYPMVDREAITVVVTTPDQIAEHAAPRKNP